MNNISDFDLSQVEYEEITEENLNEVVSIFSEYLNSGGDICNDIMMAIKQERFYGIIAIYHEQVIGFNFAMRGLCLTYPHDELEYDIYNFIGNKEVFGGGGIALLPQFRKKGISGYFMADMKQKLLERGCEYFFAEEWVYPDGTTPAALPVQKLGKEIYINYVPDFYKDINRYGMSCPVCGSDCKCGARLILVKLK